MRYVTSCVSHGLGKHLFHIPKLISKNLIPTRPYYTTPIKCNVYIYIFPKKNWVVLPRCEKIPSFQKCVFFFGCTPRCCTVNALLTVAMAWSNGKGCWGMEISDFCWRLPWEPTTFIFRVISPIFWGLKTFIFHHVSWFWGPKAYMCSSNGFVFFGFWLVGG